MVDGGVHAAVDNVQFFIRQGEMAFDLVAHHARIAHYRAQPRAFEQPALGGEQVAVIGIERHAEARERA